MFLVVQHRNALVYCVVGGRDLQSYSIQLAGSIDDFLGVG